MQCQKRYNEYRHTRTYTKKINKLIITHTSSNNAMHQWTKQLYIRQRVAAIVGTDRKERFPSKNVKTNHFCLFRSNFSCLLSSTHAVLCGVKKKRFFGNHREYLRWEEVPCGNRDLFNSRELLRSKLGFNEATEV